MIGLNEAKSRLALRICGKLDHLAACNKFFLRIYLFILFCFYLGSLQQFLYHDLFIYIVLFLSFYLGSLQQFIFSGFVFFFDISFRFCVYSIVIVGPIDDQLEDW